ncbi:MAG: hypothetical protein ACYDCQ_12820 [Dehalococcoidia bacterium]
MTLERPFRPDARTRAAIDELTALVRQHYPTATFAVGPSEDDLAVTHITATVDIDDPDEVVDLVIDRMLELQIEEGLAVHLIPVRTPARVKALRQRHRRRSPALPAVPFAL